MKPDFGFGPPSTPPFVGHGFCQPLALSYISVWQVARSNIRRLSMMIGLVNIKEGVWLNVSQHDQRITLLGPQSPRSRRARWFTWCEQQR